MGRVEPDYVIRPYRRSDRQAVRAICAATAWMGEPAPRLAGDEWIWAEYWTRFFTDRDRRACWVVEAGRGGRIVGYLTGTADAARFEKYVPYLLPGIVWRVIRRRLMRRREPRRAILNLLRSLLGGEMALSADVARRFPAAFHFNLLTEARRRGLGSRLLRTFLGRMRTLGVPGVHAQVISRNEASVAAMKRAGFQYVSERPLHAFAHCDSRAMTIQTWVMDLTKDRNKQQSTVEKAM